MIQKLNALAEYIRKNYQTIILVAVLLGLGLGIWSAAPGRFIQTFSPELTFMMILFISLTIQPRQVALVARQPGPVLAGLALNFIFMPLLCWGLARLLISDSMLATGIILVGVVPCAGMAAVWTALLKGDVPISMAINALTMVLAPFLIPPLMALFAGSTIAINSWGMFSQLAVILLIPLILGMSIRGLADRYWVTNPWLPLMPALSALTAVLLMFAICNINVPLIRERLSLVPSLIGAVALIFPLGFLIPHWLGGAYLDRAKRIAVTYSAGMKNLPIAVGLAFASFPKLVGLPVALAMVLQMLTASIFYRIMMREEHSSAPQL